MSNEALAALAALEEVTGEKLPAPPTPAGDMSPADMRPIIENGKRIGFVGRVRNSPTGGDVMTMILPIRSTALNNPPEWGLFQGLGTDDYKEVLKAAKSGVIKPLPGWTAHVQSEGAKNPKGTFYIRGDAGRSAFWQLTPFATPREGTGQNGEPQNTHRLSFRVKPPERIAKEKEERQAAIEQLRANNPGAQDRFIPASQQALPSPASVAAQETADIEVPEIPF